MSLERLLTKAAARRFRDVELPEIQETVRMRSLTERERASFEQAITGKDGKLATGPALHAAKRKLVAMSLCDENGERLVPDDQIERLADLDAAVIQRLFEAATQLAGIDSQNVDKHEGN